MSGDMCGKGQHTEITVQIDQETADRLNEIAWGYAMGREKLIKQLCEKAAEQSPH